MKLSVVAVVAATAGFVQVGAAPLNAMIITPAGREGAPAIPRVANLAALRFGHPVAAAITSNPEFTHHRHASAVPVSRRPCGRMMRNSRFRQKAIEISNAIRQAFGMTLIEAHGHFVHGPNGAPVYIEKNVVSFPNNGRQYIHIAQPPSHVRFYQQGQSFMGRLHYSLMNLGPWEGRAVAFVLGCGIGVLLRMIFVLFVVGYRSIKGPKPEEHVYTEVIFIEAEEVDDVAPPSYPIDQKTPIEESK